MSNTKSANDNVVVALKRLSLIDDECVLTPRGNKWRADSTYPDACDEIIKDIYPDELTSFTKDDGTPDNDQVKTWFTHQGFGESNANNMASTYTMIAKREVPDSAISEAPKKKEQPKTSKTSKKSRQTKNESAKLPSNELASAPVPIAPSLHLDIQIHIPPDASAEQLDRIFASMSKHLYGRE